jgi:hypothetical protein
MASAVPKSKPGPPHGNLPLLIFLQLGVARLILLSSHGGEKAKIKDGQD